MWYFWVLQLSQEHTSWCWNCSHMYQVSGYEYQSKLYGHYGLVVFSQVNFNGFQRARNETTFWIMVYYFYESLDTQIFLKNSRAQAQRWLHHTVCSTNYNGSKVHLGSRFVQHQKRSRQIIILQCTHTYNILFTRWSWLLVNCVDSIFAHIKQLETCLGEKSSANDESFPSVTHVL